MNCVKGDIAVITEGHLAGFIVLCVEFSKSTHGKDAWIIDRALQGRYKRVTDRVLKPLRDNPGEDETLTWQPVLKQLEHS